MDRRWGSSACTQGAKNYEMTKNTIVVNRHLDYAEAAHQYSTEATSAKDVVTKHIGTLDTDNQLFHVIFNAPSASAGDFFLSIQTPALEDWIQSTFEFW